MGIKFGVITDVHYRDGTAQAFWTLGDDQYRQFSTADARLQAFLEAMEAEGDVSFCVQLGDLVDASSGDRAADLAAALNRYDTDYSGAVYNVLGNHEETLFDGTAGDEFSDYWTTMDTAASAPSRENEWNPDV